MHPAVNDASPSLLRRSAHRPASPQPPAQLSMQKFWVNHLCYPLLAFVLAVLVISVFHLDRVVADALYWSEGHQWALKDSWITTTLIHKGGKNLSIAIAVVTFFLLAGSWLTPALRHWRRPLTFLLLATATSSLLVVSAKSLTHIACPWDFNRYGGSLPFMSELDQFLHSDSGRCFPAGHASAGYAWLALYFVGLYRHSGWRWLGLLLAVLMGVVFGVSQQLRGAHFISHDVWTFAISWFTALVWFRLALYRSYKQSLSNSVATTSPVLTSTPSAYAAETGIKVSS
ncbi:PAP2 family protein [Pokkaliibacter plantistimulans]|uniref:PAP2 family protein n=1 Tax=Proteobacteria bacterium 228 TaxID=2083153 RepID=A0A2S5KJS2_9PROT|nr:phosphatase PAP2 family protein [Pokkaliibacter plantistimulans]PPC75087.1 PAP2 family protein [Pokkaliibacter plantistimulans]